MNNPPSPYPDVNCLQPSGQAPEPEILYSYPHTAGFPQPGYPPMPSPHRETQTVYADAQLVYTGPQPAYTGSMEAQPAGYLLTRKSLNSLWIVLTALALLLLVAGGSIYYYFQIQSTPEKTLQAYCSAVKNDDGQALYDTYSSEAQTQTDEEHLQQGMRLIELLSGGIENCTIDEGSIHESDDHATANLTFGLYSGRVSNATLNLVDENGQWKVENNAIFP